MAEARAPGRRPGATPACPASSSSPWTPRVVAIRSFAGRVVGERQRAAEIEPLDDRARIDAFEHPDEHVADRRPDQIARDLLGPAQLAFVLELELAGDRRQRGVDVGHARDDELFAVGERAALRIRDDQLERRDRQALADAGSLVDLAIGARLKRHFLDDLAHVVRDLDRARCRRDRSTLPAW